MPSWSISRAKNILCIDHAASEISNLRTSATAPSIVYGTDSGAIVRDWALVVKMSRVRFTVRRTGATLGRDG